MPASTVTGAFGVSLRPGVGTAPAARASDFVHNFISPAQARELLPCLTSHFFEFDPRLAVRSEHVDQCNSASLNIQPSQRTSALRRR